MSFRLKIIVSLFVVLVFFFFVSDFMTRVVIFNTFKQIEQNFGIGEIGRITYFIQDAFKQFDYTVRDWARWDDTYQFVEKPSQKYIFANLTNESFKNVNVDLMIFLNKEGKVVFSKWYDKTLNKLVDLPQDALNKVVSDFKKRDTVGLKGLDIINHIPVLVISQPILRTDGSGPSRGTLIMARSFDIDQVKRMTALTHLYADYFVLNNKLPKEIIEILPKLRDKLIDLKATSPNLMIGYLLLNDIRNKPILIFKIEIPRMFYHQAQIFYNILALNRMGMLFLAILVFFLSLHFVIVKPIEKIKHRLKEIANKCGITKEIKAEGRDEISELEDLTKSLLEEFEKKYLKLS